VLFSGWSSPRQDAASTPGDEPTADLLLRREEGARAMMRAWLDLEKPVVAAVEATPPVPTLPLMADIVVAERHVEFWDLHVPAGLASATQPFLWPMSTGLAIARRYILTGDRMSAEEAARAGLIAEVVDTGASYERGMEFAQKLASFRPETLKLTKRALNQWQRPMLAPVYEHTLALEFLTMPSQFGGQRWSREGPAKAD
ncbi:MAG TPA: enoyl-CoA hydratase-related protein, partial [Jatrophihabitans sp.]